MARKPKAFASKRVTSVDVAREAGVSAVTVGLTLRDDPKITEKTKAVVRAAARKLRYRPRAAASTLAGGRTHAVGLVIPRVEDLEFTLTAFVPAIATMGSRLTERNYVTVLSTWYQVSTNEPPKAEPLPPVFRQSGIEGLLAIRAPVDATLEKTLHDSLLPYIIIDAPPAPGRLAIHVDERLAMQQAVEHLVQLGHQRIAFLSITFSPKPAIYQPVRHGQYLQGYVAAMKAAGLSPLSGWDDLNIEEDSVIETIVKRVRSGQEATALIAYDNCDAMTFIRGLNQKGLRVPEDVSIVSLHDRHDVGILTKWNAHMPSITRYPNTLAEMSEIAVDKLIEMIETEQLIDPQDTPAPIILPPKLIIGESTGPPPALRSPGPPA